MQCPACRAENDQKPTCRRCRADLSLLWTIEEQRGRLLEAARGCLRRGELGPALRHLDAARKLRRGQDVDRLEAVARVLGCNFAEALRQYFRTVASEAEA